VVQEAAVQCARLETSSAQWPVLASRAVECDGDVDADEWSCEMASVDRACVSYVQWSE
jgi:hypothetical protein